MVATVHYEQDYDNAFWDGTQLVFGDGDGQVFDRFTKPIDVLGHELSHAVTQFTADLTYQGQSGALNESMSDVFGACIKQRHLGQDAASADWLVGEGIFLPGINGKALRSMSDPGTAYDDPQIGKDPQVGSMADYVDTTDDNGGVHLNSGIPNRAFVLAAQAIGGESWSGAGQIWYAALTSGLSADSDFATFAAATVAAPASTPRPCRTPGTPSASAPGRPRPPPPPGARPGRPGRRAAGGFAGLDQGGRRRPRLHRPPRPRRTPPGAAHRLPLPSAAASPARTASSTASATWAPDGRARAGAHRRPARAGPAGAGGLTGRRTRTGVVFVKLSEHRASFTPES